MQLVKATFKKLFSAVGFRTGICILLATLCGVAATLVPGAGLALLIPASILKIVLIVQPFMSTASVILWGLAGYFGQKRIPRGGFANIQAVASGLASYAGGDKTKLFNSLLNTFKSVAGTITPDDVVRLIGNLATETLAGNGITIQEQPPKPAVLETATKAILPESTAE